MCLLQANIYTGVVEIKQFGGPNPHVDPHSDVGAVTQMDMSKKEEKINGTEQVNGTEQGRGQYKANNLEKDRKGIRWC